MGKGYLVLPFRFYSQKPSSKIRFSSVSPVTIPALTTIVERQFKDRTLCPVRALRYYLDRTKDLRGSRSLLLFPSNGPSWPLRPFLVGFSVDQIMQACHWKAHNTFTNFTFKTLLRQMMTTYVSGSTCSGTSPRPFPSDSSFAERIGGGGGGGGGGSSNRDFKPRACNVVVKPLGQYISFK